MTEENSSPRVIGALLVLQLAGFIVPFVLLHPVAATPPDFLANAASSLFQIKIAVAWLVVNGCITVAISTFLWPTLSRRDSRTGTWILAVSVFMLVLQAVDNAFILSIVWLSQQFVNSAGSSSDQIQLISGLLGTTRRWIHYEGIVKYRSTKSKSSNKPQPSFCTIANGSRSNFLRGLIGMTT